MKKPSLKLVDYNKAKPNPQKYNPVTGQGRLSVKVVKGALQKISNGIKKIFNMSLIPEGPYSWNVLYENFVLGKGEEQFESWDSTNPNTGFIKDCFKIGGKFLPIQASTFVFIISRPYKVGSQLITFEWKFKWVYNSKTRLGVITEIIEKEDENEEEEITEIIPKKPDPKKPKRVLLVEVCKKNRIVELLQSILYFVNRKFIYTHFQFRFSDSKQSFSAEKKGMMYVPMATKKQFPRGLEVYEVPVYDEKKLKIAQDLFDKYNNYPYDMGLYITWYLNVGSIYLFPYFILMGLLTLLKIINPIALIVSAVIALILYGPVRIKAKKNSLKGWACTEFNGMVLDAIGVDFGWEGKYSIASPYISRRIIRALKWKLRDPGIVSN